MGTTTAKVRLKGHNRDEAKSAINFLREKLENLGLNCDFEIEYKDRTVDSKMEVDPVVVVIGNGSNIREVFGKSKWFVAFLFYYLEENGFNSKPLDATWWNPKRPKSIFQLVSEMESGQRWNKSEDFIL